MSKKLKLLLTLLVLSVVGGIAGFATWSAFSSTTSNGANNFDAGTVYLDDNDGGTVMWDLQNRKPGDSVDKCVRVRYGGTLDSDVRIYTADTISPKIGPYVSLTITPGSQTTPNMDCSTFTPDAGLPLFDGKLGAFASTHDSYTDGLADHPGSATKWVTNDAVVYKFHIQLDDDNRANKGSDDPAYVPGGAGYASGAHTFTWEARNQ